MVERGKGRGLALGLLMCAVLAAAGAGSARAQAPEWLFVADTKRTGSIDLFVAGPPGARVTISELIGGKLHPLTTAELNPLALLYDASFWRCDRLARHFVATLSLADGTVATTSYEVRTPSCRNRFFFDTPGVVRPGEAARVSVSDRWQIGGVPLSLCRAAPGEGFRCRPLGLERGRKRATRALRFDRRGRWRVELRGAGRRIRRRVVVGEGGQGFVLHGRQPPLSLLLTGDSLISSLDSALGDRLGRRARAHSDVRPATGISKPGSGWIAYARRQARRRQDATVVFLGGNDGFDMDTPAGARVTCCGEPWIAEYSRRVQKMMRLYLHGGTTPVLWITVPAPRDPDYAPAVAALNEAIRRAASVSPGAGVLHLDTVLTPGFRYRDVLTYKGKRRRVRQDGFHLSLAGASIAASLVARELRSFGLL
jgi:lysophospholipase L1-like esterase